MVLQRLESSNPMPPKAERLPPLEDGLLRAMKALDNQISREMQRSPEELEKHGVQKWEPHRKRVEHVTSFLLDMLGEQVVELDSMMVLAEAMTKALFLTAQDLEAKGLGKVRTSYCIDVMEKIGNDSYRTLQLLRDTPALT